MDDAELQAIRAARLQEMQRNSQGGSGNGDGKPNSSANGNENEAINSMLTQILDHEAKERLNRVRMVKPERVAGVENYLMRLYQSGGLREKVGEEELVELLDKIASEERRNNTTSIRFARKEYGDSKLDTVSNNVANKESDSEDEFFDE
jgi:programmed cell death protein 5